MTDTIARHYIRLFQDTPRGFEYPPATDAHLLAAGFVPLEMVRKRVVEICAAVAEDIQDKGLEELLDMFALEVTCEWERAERAEADRHDLRCRYEEIREKAQRYVEIDRNDAGGGLAVQTVIGDQILAADQPDQDHCGVVDRMSGWVCRLRGEHERHLFCRPKPPRVRHEANPEPSGIAPGCNRYCASPGHHRQCQCRADTLGLPFASDEWCDCPCHRSGGVTMTKEPAPSSYITWAALIEAVRFVCTKQAEQAEGPTVHGPASYAMALLADRLTEQAQEHQKKSAP